MDSHQPVSITKVKQQLAEAIVATEHLDSTTDASLIHERDQVESTLSQLESSLQTLEEPAYLERIKRKARKLEKHKQWKKRHAENGKRRQEQIEKRRQKLEADIDRWQAEVRQEDERRQREDQEKQLLTKKEKQDSQRRKIKDLSRLIERLIELRRLRRKRLEAQGHFFPEEGNEFFEKVKAWNEQADSLFEKNQDLQERRSDEKEEEDTVVYIHPEDKWETRSLDHSAYKYWMQGLQNTENLLRIRKQWDYYLVDDQDPNGTKVPPTWVSPAPPSNWIWATYLVHTEEQPWY